MMEFNLLKAPVILVMLCFITQITDARDNLRAPAQLQIKASVDKPDVELSWWAPGSPLWFHYDSGNYNMDIGLNAAGEMDAAIACDTNDLKPFAGMQLTRFAFVPAEEDAIYIFKIWTGEMADSVIYQDTLSGLNFNQWNIITLDSAIKLDANQGYYFGYHVNAQDGYPIGCDEGPTAVPGKSDLIRTENGPFYSLNEMDIDVNINLQLYFESVDGKCFKKLNKSRDIANFNHHEMPVVYRDNKTSVAISHCKEASPDSYNVYRNNQVIANTAEPNYTDVLELSGEYTYSVTAIYGDQESDHSNEVKTLFDNNRIPVNFVVGEAFINCGSNNGISNSPSSPGVFMGMLDMEDKNGLIAPLYYHSATEILGDDPFSTDFAEERFNRYLNQTLSFPMAAFNGDLIQGGGSDDNSLYSSYQVLFDSAHNVLTPIGLTCRIDKISNTKYQLKATITNEGFLANTTIYLQAILALHEVDYSWNNGQFSFVRNVVQDGFPGGDGTLVSFGNKTTIEKSVDITIDPFNDLANYRVVVLLHTPSTLHIWNSDYLKLPLQRNIVFKVSDANNLPVIGSVISIDENSLTTDANGIAATKVLDNAGLVNYTVTKESYTEYSGNFDAAIADTVFVRLANSKITSQSFEVLQVYPNPVADKLFIQCDDWFNVEIYDITGNKVKESNQLAKQMVIDLSGFESGIYLLKLRNDNKIQSIKIRK